MANYIGNQPLNGEFKVLDSIESQFNNSSTSFGLKYNTASQTVGDAAQLIVSLNGVIQQPLTSYTLSGVTNIVFASPPSSGDTCFIVLLGGIGGTVTPSDNSVTTEKLTNSSVTSAKIVNNTITADDMDSSDSYAFAGVNVGSTFVTDTVNDRIGVGTTNPTYPLDVEDDGTGFIKGSFVSTGSAHSTITFDNTGSAAASVRVGSNNDDFYVRTSGSEKLRVTSAGNVGIGTASPSAKLDVAETDSVTYSSSAIQGDLIISRKNSGNTANEVVGLEFDVTGWSGITTGVAGISAIQTGSNVSSAALSFQTRNSGTIGERMRIDSSGNLLVGTTSTVDASKLYVSGNIGTTGNQFNARPGSGVDYEWVNRVGAGHTFYVNNATILAARIDNSGNLLVGTTSTGAAAGGSGTSGININASGAIEVARSANPVMFVNRTTSDGDIMQFRKDGTTVGSIGSRSGSQLYIEGEDGGIQLYQNGIRPNRNGALSDATQSIGTSGYRWTDLYLSGGVYVGGTGSANYLDDYEEGTWTPVVAYGTATYTTQRGRYTKIGRVVHIHFFIQIASISGSNNFDIISGLPFAAKNDVNYTGLAAKTNNYNWGGSSTMITFQVRPNSSTIGAVRSGNNQAFGDVSSSGISAGTWIAASGHYVTDA